MSAFNSRAHTQRHGKGLVTFLIVLAVIVAGSYFGIQKYRASQPQDSINVVTYTIERDQFVHEVVERGEIESSSNVEIRCQVKSRNSSGISIFEVVDEGTQVEAGDVVCKLDSSALEQELVQQQIACNTTEAAMIQARNSFEAAQIAKKEYVDGTFDQEKQTIQSEIFIAEENLRRAKEYVGYSERLAARGYATSQQLEGDRFAVQKAQTELDAAKTKLRVLEDFTKAKMVKQLDSDIKTAEAQWKSEQSSYKLELEKLEDLKNEIDGCILKAPQAGQVVHANESSRRGDNDFIVEPGAMVREGQVLIRLPDPSQMQVKAKINESQVTLLAAGMPAKVRLDAFGDQLLDGVVTRVNEYPEPTSWYSSQVKEYATFIKINESMDGIKPGLTAEVQIQVNRENDVVQIPVQAIHEHGRKMYCFVQSGNDWEPREIVIGGNNDSFVVPQGGISEGEVVAMDPKALLNSVELPAIEAEQDEEVLVAKVDTSTAKSNGAKGGGRPPSAGKPKSGRPSSGSGGPAGGGGGFNPTAIVDSIFTKHDTNKDGILSSDEIPSERAARFAKSDKNGDGNIEKAELVQAMKAMAGAASGGSR